MKERLDPLRKALSTHLKMYIVNHPYGLSKKGYAAFHIVTMYWKSVYKKHLGILLDNGSELPLHFGEPNYQLSLSI